MSIGKAFGIMSGRLTGNVGAAKKLLDETPPGELMMRNRNESRTKSRRKNFKFGRRLGYR